MQERTLVVVAHMDDETLSCAGLIMRREQVDVLAIYGRRYAGEAEDLSYTAEKKCFKKACSLLGVQNADCFGLQEGEPHQVGYYKVLEAVEAYVKDRPYTEVVFPSERDMNQDHRMLSDVMKIVCRPGNLGTVRRVLKSIAHDSTLATPQYFVPMDRHDMLRKIEAMNCYEREVRYGAHPRSAENMYALARIHGSKCGVELAEGYDVHMTMEIP